jgi:hypothetical protein
MLPDGFTPRALVLKEVSAASLDLETQAGRGGRVSDAPGPRFGPALTCEVAENADFFEF